MITKHFDSHEVTFNEDLKPRSFNSCIRCMIEEMQNCSNLAAIHEDDCEVSEAFDLIAGSIETMIRDMVQERFDRDTI